MTSTYESEPIVFPPQDLRNTIIDVPAIFTVIVVNFVAAFIGLTFLSEADTRSFVKLILVLALGWGPLFFLANRATGLRFDFFFSRQEATSLATWVSISMIIQIVLALFARKVDRMAFAATLGLSAAGSNAVYLALMSAVNEEFAMANLQRILTMGIKHPIVVFASILARGIVFWGLHKPFAYTYAPVAIQLTLFGSGIVQGVIFATTKRFSVVIFGHLLWNALAV